MTSQEETGLFSLVLLLRLHGVAAEEEQSPLNHQKSNLTNGNISKSVRKGPIIGEDSEFLHALAGVVRADLRASDAIAENPPSV
jgi:hypothetical protein